MDREGCLPVGSMLLIVFLVVSLAGGCTLGWASLMNTKAVSGAVADVGHGFADAERDVGKGLRTLLGAGAIAIGLIALGLAVFKSGEGVREAGKGYRNAKEGEALVLVAEGVQKYGGELVDRTGAAIVVRRPLQGEAITSPKVELLEESLTPS